MSRRRLRLAARLLPFVLVALVGCRSEPHSLDCGDCNLLLVSIDTLRADRLGCYGGPRPTSPALDALAAESILFEHAVSASYLTAESHASIFTSSLPSVHEISNASAMVGNSLAPGLVTMAEALAAAGLRTEGFHGGGNVASIFGFGRGFDRYQVAHDLADAASWIRHESGGRRFFLFLHTYHVHDPYTPRVESLRRLGIEPREDVEIEHSALEREAGDGGFAAIRDRFWSQIDRDDPADVAYALALYDAEILEVDELVGGLVRDVLEAAPRTLVVITSDHGEAFGEHGRFLHDSLYEEAVHVPLILRHPHRRASRISGTFSQLDLAPTLLDLLDVPRPVSFQGRSQRAFLESGGPIERPAIAEKMLLEKLEGESRPRVTRYEASGTFGPLKVHLRSASRVVQLYDLAEDPRERIDLAAERTELRDRALADLERVLAASDTFARQFPRDALPRDFQLPPELARQLRALGYLN